MSQCPYVVHNIKVMTLSKLNHIYGAHWDIIWIQNDAKLLQRF